MKKVQLFLLVACFAMIANGQSVSQGATEPPKPGTIIEGHVIDAITKLPLPYADIIETVENDTAAYYYTFADSTGYFSFPLVGFNHVIKVLFDGYKRIKVPINEQKIEIEVEVAPDGIGKDGVTYIHDVVRNIADFTTPEEERKKLIGPNIRVLKRTESINE